MEITFLYDADFGTITGVIMSTETTSEDIRRIVEDIREEKPDEWTWDDIWMKQPSDCDVYDRLPYNTVQIQRGENNGKVTYQTNRCGDWFCTICCGTVDAAERIRILTLEPDG